MKALVIIPARLNSTRLLRKMLRLIGPKTLIEWTYEAARRSGLPVMVATDSEEIEAECKRFGARVIMTPDCANGTERCAAALDRIDEDPEFVVNWQGDSPCVAGGVARALVDYLESYTDPPVMTPVRLMQAVERGQSVAVVRSADMGALVFTRQPVPTGGPYWAHIGMYGYRAEALRRYGIKPGPLEQAEKLEQNRWIEQGDQVMCIPIDRAGSCAEVNEPSDLVTVAEALGVGK